MSDKKISVPRQIKGRRPHFFDDEALDQFMTFFMELTTEVSVMRDRLDTVERVLETKGTLTRDDIEHYQAPGVVEQDRTVEREAFARRVFRMHTKTKDT